jgi:hypothetical protein
MIRTSETLAHGSEEQEHSACKFHRFLQPRGIQKTKPAGFCQQARHRSERMSAQQPSHVVSLTAGSR